MDGINLINNNKSCGTTKKDLTHNPVKIETEKVLVERKNAQMTRTTTSRPIRMQKILKSVTAIDSPLDPTPGTSSVGTCGEL
jgi:hypothetical protein